MRVTVRYSAAEVAKTNGVAEAGAIITRRVTAFCEKTADGAFHAWLKVFLDLFALTRDGFTITKSTVGSGDLGLPRINCFILYYFYPTFLSNTQSHPLVLRAVQLSDTTLGTSRGPVADLDRGLTHFRTLFYRRRIVL